MSARSRTDPGASRGPSTSGSSPRPGAVNVLEQSWCVDSRLIAVKVPITPKCRKETMIDTIIDGGPISPSSQCKLLALLRSSDNVDGLVKLCSIEDLDPAVDALLATIPNPRVRSAWLMRPGRTQDEIVTMIRSEKRVTILAEIAALELPPGLHARLLEATDSVKVSLAIVESPHAPAELRVQAACKAAARDLNH